MTYSVGDIVTTSWNKNLIGIIAWVMPKQGNAGLRWITADKDWYFKHRDCDCFIDLRALRFICKAESICLD